MENNYIKRFETQWNCWYWSPILCTKYNSKNKIECIQFILYDLLYQIKKNDVSVINHSKRYNVNMWIISESDTLDDVIIFE